MKRRRTIMPVLMIALSVTTNTSVRAANRASQEPEKLTFEMLFCGLSMFQSHQGYRVSDGTSLNVDLVTYPTIGKAKKAIANELKAARRIDERKDQLDETGKRIGERIVVVVSGDGGTERTILLSLENKTLYRIEAASLGHILQFQKSGGILQAPAADPAVRRVL